MERRRRVVASLMLLLIAAGIYVAQTTVYQPPIPPIAVEERGVSAVAILETLEVKGRAAKTGYSREQFGDGWARQGVCDQRNIILARDLVDEIVSGDCKVISGRLNDPYTGRVIMFVRGATTSDDVQIDHVVALSDAWQKGAQYWTELRRAEFANDPLELLAVDGQANQDKGASDAATWLPPYKPFRCQYVARQIAIKVKYELWVTAAEKSAMQRVLSSCPEQQLPAGISNGIVVADV